jgi:hypothetical protein
MKKITLYTALAVTAFLVTLAVALPTHSAGEILEATSTVSELPAVPKVDRRLEVWLSALEWCESRGIPEAINAKDRDGTPSYYSFQFKPSTFILFGKQYGLITSTSTKDARLDREMRDTELTRAIVRRMARDPEVNMYNQFPDCISRKIGPPPNAQN